MSTQPIAFAFAQRQPIMRVFLVSLLVLTMALLPGANASAQTKPVEEPFTVEDYYKVKWGFANEFIDLWKKNHYPLLKKAMQKGDILSVTAEIPILHSGEDTRWDFKVTIVYKNTDLAFARGLTSPYKKELYPDLDKLAKDEQHRFELLIAHWDVMTDTIDLK